MNCENNENRREKNNMKILDDVVGKHGRKPQRIAK